MSTLAKAKSISATGAPFVCSDAPQALSSQSQWWLAQLWGEISVLLPKLCGPWDSAMISAQPLCVGHPLAPASGAHGGGSWHVHSQSPLRWRMVCKEAAVVGCTPPFTCDLTVALHFCGRPWFLPCTPLVATILCSSPFRLSPCSQPQSSPWVCPLNPEFQHPAPALTRWMHIWCWEHRRVVQTICAGLSRSACCKLVVVLSAEPLKLSLCPG